MPLEDAPVVLIIEDNAEVAQLEQAILSLAAPPYRVIWHQTGESGLEAARSKGADVILLDLSLGDMEGREVLHALRARPETACIPVIVVSAYMAWLEPEDLEMVQVVLQKPFGIDRLLGAVASAIDARKAH